MNHWDTQVVHLSVEWSLWSSSNNRSLGNTLSSISDGSALLLFTMMEIANSNFLPISLATFPRFLLERSDFSFLIFSYREKIVHDMLHSKFWKIKFLSKIKCFLLLSRSNFQIWPTGTVIWNSQVTEWHNRTRSAFRNPAVYSNMNSDLFFEKSSFFSSQHSPSKKLGAESHGCKLSQTKFKALNRLKKKSKLHVVPVQKNKSFFDTN